MLLYFRSVLRELFSRTETLDYTTPLTYVVYCLKDFQLYSLLISN